MFLTVTDPYSNEICIVNTKNIIAVTPQVTVVDGTKTIVASITLGPNLHVLASESVAEIFKNITSVDNV